LSFGRWKEVIPLSENSSATDLYFFIERPRRIS
jgi:hypothetical protein